LPIRLLIDNSSKSYLAVDTGVLVEAFECTLNELGLADRSDPATIIVAKHIIAFAKAARAIRSKCAILQLKPPDKNSAKR
jgi:hypothetical protein